jgi:tetratricopeptide (TPR) repeat protein
MLRTLVTRSALVTLAALAAAGCSASKASGPTGPGAKSVASTAEATPQISNRAKLLFEDAVKSFEAQKKAKAFDYAALERKFRLAQEADENLAEADYNLGVLAERQGNVKEARKHYQSALEKKPSLRQASENLAVLTQNSGDVGGAVALYQDILQRFPDDASARARLAEIYRQTGDHDKAMEFARAARMRDPQSLPAYKVAIRSYLDRKQLSMAKLEALRAVKLDESDPELHYLGGLIFLAESKPEDARLQFVRALEARADYLPAHVQLAEMAIASENYKGAEEHLRRVLQADGKNAAAHLNLGVAYKGQGQYDKAMQEYDEAEKLDPELSAVYLNRAIVLHRAKDAPERAIELYKKYLAMAGGDVALSAEAPVFALLKDAEAAVQLKAEAARAVEEAKKMEAAQAAQESKMKAAEAQQPGGKVTPAAGTAEPAQVQPAAQKEPAKAKEPAAPQRQSVDPDEPDDAL